MEPCNNGSKEVMLLCIVLVIIQCSFQAVVETICCYINILFEGIDSFPQVRLSHCEKCLALIEFSSVIRELAALRTSSENTIVAMRSRSLVSNGNAFPRSSIATFVHFVFFFLHQEEEQGREAKGRVSGGAVGGS